MGARAELRAVRERLALLEAAAAEPPPPAPRPFSTPPPGTDAGMWAVISGAGVSRTEAMAAPTLAYIPTHLPGGMSDMDLERYRVDPATGDPDLSQELAPGWLADPDPNPNIPPSVFWTWVIDDLFFMGVSTLVVLGRDWTGFPAQVRRVLP